MMQVGLHAIDMYRLLPLFIIQARTFCASEKQARFKMIKTALLSNSAFLLTTEHIFRLSGEFETTQRVGW